MIYALLSVLAFSLLRRLDGIKKENWTVWWSFALFDRFDIEIGLKSLTGAFVRVLPVIIFMALLCHNFGYNWSTFGFGVVSGALISISMQMKYVGWSKFDMAQIGHFYLAIFGYALLCIYSIDLSAAGALCCILAGLSRPVLDSLDVHRYTVYSEFIEGGLLIAPFAIINIL